MSTPFLLTSTSSCFILYGMEKRIFFNTTLPENLLKKFKILAIELSKRQNKLLEEAIHDLLEKYEKKGSSE